MNGLAAHGHNVTFLSPDKEKNPQKNVHYLHMGEIYNELYVGISEGFFTIKEKFTPIQMPIFFSEYMVDMCQGTAPISSIDKYSFS